MTSRDLARLELGSIQSNQVFAALLLNIDSSIKILADYFTLGVELYGYLNILICGIDDVTQRLASKLSNLCA